MSSLKGGVRLINLHISNIKVNTPLLCSTRQLLRTPAKPLVQSNAQVNTVLAVNHSAPADNTCSYLPLKSPEVDKKLKLNSITMEMWEPSKTNIIKILSLKTLSVSNMH
ncbi:hypothetical protein C0J52_09189 [Blattella germanica]|nr:hypothetical protein C0J52_09189 [Blattella germanica]